MCQAYADAGFAVAGFVGHNHHVDSPTATVATVSGIEHGPGDGRSAPHVVEFPSLDFRFLAHPGLTWPTDTRARAVAFMADNGIEAVEKYNAGRQQYAGHIDAIELANDDAHNPLQIGQSYMVVDVPTASPDAVVAAIRRGNVELVNRGFSWAGKLVQGAALWANRAVGRTEAEPY